MQTMKRLAAFLLLAALLVTAGGCNLLLPEEELPESPVSLAPSEEEFSFAVVERGDLARRVTLSCKLQPAAEEKLSFSVNRPIANIYVAYGDSVKAGDLLADLSQEGLEEELILQSAAVKEAALAVEQARESRAIEEQVLSWELKQIQLLNDPFAAEEKQRQIRQAAEDYEERLRLLSEHLRLEEEKEQELLFQKDSLQLRAPIDGMVTFVRNMEEGSLSQKGLHMITVSNLDSALFIGKAEDADYFTPGEAVELVIQDAAYPAHVAPASSWPDAKPAFLLDTFLPTLKGGETAVISLVTDERKGVLLLPTNAIETANGESIVYVLDENGVKTSKPVQTGLATAEQTEIVEGLAEGDVVLID